MDNIRETKVKVKNLVGIIPIAGNDERDFNQPWPDCLMPIAPDYTLIEAAVVECAWAGCRSIWIVVNDNFAPIIRKKLGNFAGDPMWSYRAFDPNPTLNRRKIPIYYVPVPMKHRGKRDSTAFSVVHGALTAFKLTSNLSSWTKPHKYYVRFPHSYFPAYQLREFRTMIQRLDNVYLTFNGEGVKEGNLCSFTFGPEDWLEFRREIRKGTGKKVPGSHYADNEILPLEERWSARFFKPEDVFAPLIVKEENKVEMENFFNIRNWEEYCNFIAASRTLSIRKPGKSVLIRPSYNRVGGDDE
jgi:hypothetical protein